LAPSVELGDADLVQGRVIVAQRKSTSGDKSITSRYTFRRLLPVQNVACQLRD